MSALYNAASRKIDALLEFYFTTEPVSITNDDFLISFNLLEELGSDAESSPIGDVSANELDIVLYNKNGIFSPANLNSPYYGLMRSGLKVVVKLRPAPDAEWDEVGTFYVSDWYAEVTGMQASVTCFDKLYDALNSAPPTLPVTSNITYQDAFDTYMIALGYRYSLDNTLRGNLSWWYTLSEAAETLRKLTNACGAALYCDHHDEVKVLNLASKKTVTATLTDADQIITATVPQSINSSYSGLDVSVYNTQLSNNTQLLDLKDHAFPSGNSETGMIQFSTRPVVRVECVVATKATTTIDLTGFQSTQDAIKLKTYNKGVIDTTMSITAYGRAIEAVKSTYYSHGSNQLVHDNEYVQTSEVAERISRMLNNFVHNPLPNLKLSIRGNPKLNLGDKITVSSERYNLLFTGILQRANYTYNGALHCDINLVDSTILEVG